MNTVIHSFSYALDYLRELVEDLSSEQLVQRPRGIINHPAWTIGHLSLTCQELGGILDIPAWLPDNFSDLHGSGSQPESAATAYLPKGRAIEILTESERQIVDTLSSIDNSALDSPFPDESYRDVFPTVRHALVQVLVGHTSFHVGQISLWRRAMGLPPVGRSFE